MLILILLQQNLFLNAFRPKKLVIWQFLDVSLYLILFYDQYKTQEICDIVASLYSFLVVYCPDKYITHRMYYEAVDDPIVALKLICDRYVTNEVIKKLYTALYADDGLLFFDEDSGDAIFCCDEMGRVSVNLNNINLDNSFDEDDYSYQTFSLVQ